MRDNSGQGKSSNNLKDPTLKEHEAERGHSGRAITGDKKAATPASRKGSREEQTAS